MAFTTPRTWVAGEITTAANLNTHLRDNVAWMATDSPACRAYKSTNFSHNSTGNWLAITLDSERFDNASFHSTSSNTARFTVPASAGGKYLVGAAAAWDTDTTGERMIGMGLNGTATWAAVQSLPANGVICAIAVATVYPLAAADYVQMAGFQNSGGTRTVTSAGNYSPEAWAFWFRT